MPSSCVGFLRMCWIGLKSAAVAGTKFTMASDVVGVSRRVSILSIFVRARGDMSKNNGNFDMFGSCVYGVDMNGVSGGRCRFCQ